MEAKIAVAENSREEWFYDPSGASLLVKLSSAAALTRSVFCAAGPRCALLPRP